ncbi:MAG: DNA polymerase IV [Clostridia bacterium]|nr:DNA polymerase IV [Clostridia bacterium]
MDRTVLHCDCNAFFASCECARDPSLKNVPMAVCGDPDKRHGIILAKNELAKAFDVRTAETLWQAKKKCPALVLVRPHYDLYADYSHRCNAIYRDYTDLVEPFGIDESWLDVTNSRLLFGDGKTIADTIRARFREELGLTCSIGVAFNKSLAKLGSDYKKPDATTVITRENLRSLVWPLPVERLLYVGRSTVKVLKSMGIGTIGELAQTPPSLLTRKLGKAGAMLSAYARGEETEPVASAYAEHNPKSVSCGMTFRHDLLTRAQLRTGLLLVCEEFVARLRYYHVKCTQIALTVKYDDFFSESKQAALDHATNLRREIFDRALALAEQMLNGKPVRSLTVSGSKLMPETSSYAQLSMFDEDLGRRDKLSRAEDALADIREKYGKQAVKLGALMDTDLE